RSLPPQRREQPLPHGLLLRGRGRADLPVHPGPRSRVLPARALPATRRPGRFLAARRRVRVLDLLGTRQRRQGPRLDTAYLLAAPARRLHHPQGLPQLPPPPRPGERGESTLSRSRPI